MSFQHAQLLSEHPSDGREGAWMLHCGECPAAHVPRPYPLLRLLPLNWNHKDHS